MFRSANNDEGSNSVPSGKNYVFDKRFSHAPGAIEAVDRTKKVLGVDANTEAEKAVAKSGYWARVNHAANLG